VATIAKRETIIQKVEDIVLFLNKMKSLYIRDIRFEDHDRFLQLCYRVDYESRQIDVTEKKHNFYIQGAISRPRRYDEGRVETTRKMYEIDVRDDFILMMEMRRKAKLARDKQMTPGANIEQLQDIRRIQNASDFNAEASAIGGS